MIYYATIDYTLAKFKPTYLENGTSEAKKGRYFVPQFRDIFALNDGTVKSRFIVHSL